VREHPIVIQVDGRALEVRPGTMVAAALIAHGLSNRVSRSGEPRAALCGMGICYECRATVNGVAHQRTCMLACTHGMEIATG
jgi:succinate dehydrogenase/fumarate reductase-like Fe-S protein